MGACHLDPSCSAGDAYGAFSRPSVDSSRGNGAAVECGSWGDTRRRMDTHRPAVSSVHRAATSNRQTKVSGQVRAYHQYTKTLL